MSVVGAQEKGNWGGMGGGGDEGIYEILAKTMQDTEEHKCSLCQTYKSELSKRSGQMNNACIILPVLKTCSEFLNNLYFPASPISPSA
jgi:hypothetical protein